MLFFIVLMFLFCHFLRLTLNIYGLYNLNKVRASIANGCNGAWTFWELIATSVSHFLLTINSSINFFIYCFMCSTFR